MKLRDKIISGSVKLFSQKGYLGTSLNDILETAGASKGGFYNHFKTKEALFFVVLSESRKIWREKTLAGLDRIDKPSEKIKNFLVNYRDRYLKDADNFPGGCIFVTLSVELDDQEPHLAQELNEGFVRLKAMIHRLLSQAQKSGGIRAGVNIKDVSEMIFSGMLGASVMYGVDKSTANLDRTINALIEYLGSLEA